MRKTPGIALGAIVLIVLAVSAGQAGAGRKHGFRAAKDIDVRLDLKGARGITRTQRMAIGTLGAHVAVNWREGTPASIIRYGGYLTRASSADAATIARRFLVSHAAVYNLSANDVANMAVVSNATTRRTGVTQLSLQQLDGNRRVYGAVLTFAIDKRGRILIAGGPYYRDAHAAVARNITAAEAIEAASDAVGVDVRAPLRMQKQDGRMLVFRNTIARNVAHPAAVKAELVTFPMPAGRPARLAWRTEVDTSPNGWYESIVDAQSGDVLLRRNLYEDAAPEGRVFTVQHPGIAGATRQLTPFSGIDGSWVTDRRTIGNNTNTYQDANGTNTSSCQPETPASGDPGYQVFDYAWTNVYASTSGADWTTECNATVTQQFYLTNLVHDHYYSLGFTEPFRNFQTNNFGRGGSANDPVLSEADNGVNNGCSDGATPPNAIPCVNNANFATPADGSSPRMQMYVSVPPQSYIQRAFNGDTVFHEYGHGLSNRLVGGGSLGSGVQTNAMGEGWSDFMAISYWNDPVYGDYNNGNTTNGIRTTGYGTSTYKYSTLCTIGGGCEEHNDGEIWATVLWNMRVKLVARYGAAGGQNRAELLVVDGMKNIATNPTFLTARDGILAADVARYSSANQCLIWGVFASREMGFSASTSGTNDMSPTTGTDGPTSCTPVAAIGGPYSTNEGTDKQLNAGGSTENGDGPFTYEWDLDADGQYDDATGKTPNFTRVGQDGTFTIGLKVTNANGFSDTDSTTVTVNNVAPSVAIDPISSQPENTAVSVNAVVSDPGWLDPLSATVDWGDGSSGPAAGVLEQARPDATLTLSLSHTYGDNGSFTVEICAADDDTSGNCSSKLVTISNVIPTAAIDKSGATIVNGVAAFIGHSGVPMPFSGTATDPGSDDLTTTWNWDDGSPLQSTLSLNDPGVGPDPFPSPTIHPRNVTDATSHTFADACLYTVGFSARDDDAGVSAIDNVVVIMAGNSGLARSAGYWQTQYRPRPTAFPEAKRQCYLAIAGFMSAVFNEVRDASTVAAAFDVLWTSGNGGSATQQLDRQLLAAWLNFANGGFDYGQLVDTDGNGIADTAFSTVLANAEAVRLSGASTDDDLRAQKDLLERING